MRLKTCLFCALIKMLLHSVSYFSFPFFLETGVIVKMRQCVTLGLIIISSAWT